jgi:CHU_C Type IX secretion signal domain
MTVLRYEFRVYDRWGNLMYQTGNLDDGWEGIFRAKTTEPGVYVWLLEADLAFCGKNVTLRKKGDVTVVR